MKGQLAKKSSVIFLTCILISTLFSCKDNNETPINQELIPPKITGHESLKTTPDSKNVSIKTYRTINIFNLTFEIPKNINLIDDYSTSNRKIYIENNDGNIAVTIESNEVPVGNSGNIYSLIDNDLDFANSVIADHRRNFGDAKLISYKFTKIGGAECFLINESSKSISGAKNIMMRIKNYFVLSQNNYINISISGASMDQATIESIINSFNIPQSKRNIEKHIEKEELRSISPEKNITVESQNINRPPLSETKTWILEKLRRYGKTKFDMMITMGSSMDVKNVNYSFEGMNLIVSYDRMNSRQKMIVPICACRITKATWQEKQQNYHSDLFFKSNYKSIENSGGGSNHYYDLIGLSFDLEREENLYSRFNEAINNIKTYCEQNKKSNEPF